MLVCIAGGSSLVSAMEHRRLSGGYPSTFKHKFPQCSQNPGFRDSSRCGQVAHAILSRRTKAGPIPDNGNWSHVCLSLLATGSMPSPTAGLAWMRISGSARGRLPSSAWANPGVYLPSPSRASGRLRLRQGGFAVDTFKIGCQATSIPGGQIGIALRYSRRLSRHVLYRRWGL